MLKKSPYFLIEYVYFLLLHCKSTSEFLLNVNWKMTWKKLNNRYVNIRVRDIVFKFLSRSGLYEVKSSDQGHQKFFMKGNCPTRENITMILLHMKNSGCA